MIRLNMTLLLVKMRNPHPSAQAVSEDSSEKISNFKIYLVLTIFDKNKKFVYIIAYMETITDVDVCVLLRHFLVGKISYVGYVGHKDNCDKC